MEKSFLLYLWPIKAAGANSIPFECALLPRLFQLMNGDPMKSICFCHLLDASLIEKLIFSY
jgi:hypothetical protein